MAKKKETTALVLIIDRSGSMVSIANETEAALKAFIEEQKEQPGSFTVDTVFFDNQYEERALNVDPTKEELDLTLSPRGLTALYDAVGMKINSYSEALSKIKKKPDNILFIIATDGHENSSQEYSQTSIAKLIEEKQDAGWKFTFLGANQDAVLTAKNLNIHEKDAITFAASTVGVENALRAMSSYTSSVRSGVDAGYTAADRASAVIKEK